MRSTVGSAITAEKESWFLRYERREITFEQLAGRVYQLDHRTRRSRRKLIKLIVGLFLPLLFVRPPDDS